jgi:hypothetical protein
MNERHKMNEQIEHFAEEAGLLGFGSKFGNPRRAVEKFAGLVLENERKVNGTFTGEHPTSMTLRDHFAGLAMQALIKHTPHPTQQEAKDAYALANEMLEERKK